MGIALLYQICYTLLRPKQYSTTGAITVNYLTTLSQISRTTLTAIGAKDFVKSDSDLHFTVSGNGRRGLQKIRISMANDLYTVEYFAYDRNFNVKRHETRTGIFNTQLDSVVWDLAK